MCKISCRRHRFPPIIIQHAVWLYCRFTLSYRDVEGLLAERGLDLSYETVRRWVLKFGRAYARRIQRRRPRPTERWHLDEMVVVIRGRRYFLWRAMDSEGEVLDFLIQSRRNTKAAIRLMRNLLKKRVLRHRQSSPINFVPTAQQSASSAFAQSMSRAYGRTIEPKTPISRYDDESERCSASNRQSLPRDSSPSTLPSTISSTSSAT